MGVKDEIDTDIINFFKQIENQNTNDKQKTLKNLIDKYAHISQSDYMMDWYDLQSIVNCAKTLFSNKSFPMFLGDKRKRVNQNEQANLCVIEETVRHLNHKECFKKLPRFDFREDS